MTQPAPARILLCADREADSADVRPLLEKAGHEVMCQAFEPAFLVDLPTYHVVILEGSRAPREAVQFCRHMRTRLADAFVPILFVTDDHSPGARLAGLEGGADTYLLRPFEPQELLAQVRAVLRIKQVHDRLLDKTAEVHRINKRLHQAYQQIDQELELAHRIQMSFMPQTLPEIPRLRFAVHYLLCGRVGGDFYDIFRLDENHVGFYVADAMGHGVPASLLAIYVKKSVRAKEIIGQQYRLLPPNEVLDHLNRDLIDQALSEHPFITMAYVLFNFQTGALRFARAGHPYPLYVPRHGAPRLWEVPGGLLGIFDTSYPTQEHPVQPGDKVLLYSDGIDSASFEDHPPGAESLLACARRHRGLPIQQFLERVTHDLFGRNVPEDDLTLLGMEWSAG
jgi:sigma-B regulation protein RsbU (phosphoserine phosphatase)